MFSPSFTGRSHATRLRAAAGQQIPTTKTQGGFFVSHDIVFMMASRTHKSLSFPSRMINDKFNTVETFLHASCSLRGRRTDTEMWALQAWGELALGLAAPRAVHAAGNDYSNQALAWDVVSVAS